MKKSEHATDVTQKETTAKGIPSGDMLSSDVIGKLRFSPARMVEYLGPVVAATNQRVLTDIKRLLEESPHEQIVLSVTSAGGPSGTAMSFYDTIRAVLKPHLTTIGSGDVDSSAILIFLSGSTRYVTKHTTLLFHMAGRVFKGDQRFTATEIEAMVAEDKRKDDYYADIVAAESHGKLTKKKVLTLMANNTVLTPDNLVKYGLADAILE